MLDRNGYRYYIVCACMRLYYTKKNVAVPLLLNDSLLVDAPQGISSEVVPLTQDDIPKELCSSMLLLTFEKSQRPSILFH